MEFEKVKYALLLLLFAETALGNHFSGISGCRTTKLDLVFVVDASSPAFRDGFHLVRIWIQNMTSHFDISPYSTRVAVVQSGDTPYTEFDFDTFDSTEDAIGAVSQIQFGLGFSTTGDTLRYVKDHVLHTAREDASKVVLVLSDGNIRKHNDVRKAAKQLHDMGVTTFAIGAGDDLISKRNVAYLKTIASDPMEDHLFVVHLLSDLGSLEESILSELCKNTVHECPTASHDLAFIIDGSTTIGFKNFRKIKEWMKKIVEAFDVGNEETRIAVIQYSTEVQEEIGLNDNLTKKEVLAVIDKMELMFGDTSTGYALEYCMNVIFGDGKGGRNNMPDVVIVMTDGKAQNHDHVIRASKAMHDAGIEVYAVGVSNYSLNEVKDIASDPDENHVILATGFEQIDLQRIGLIKRICTESEPGCPSTAADIVFLVDDAVTSVSNNLQHVKAWLKTMVDTQEVGPHYARIGLARYANDPELVFGLSAYSSTSSVINAISMKLRNETGNANMGRAIDYVRTVVFHEARKDVPKFLIVLTEANSDDEVGGAVIRAKKSGIQIFTFGVGREVNIRNLQQIASDPEKAFHDDTFDGIRRQHGKFTSAMCELSEPACDIQEIDLQFLVDGSSKIQGSNFDKVKTWIRNVIRSFDIGSYTTRVGLTQYSSGIQNEFNMNTFKTKREIEHAVEKMRFMGGNGHIGFGLKYIMDHSFTAEAGSREGAAKVLVVLSDGNSEDSIDEVIQTVHDAGVRVFAVGAGSNTDRKYLEQMATEPTVSHVTEAASYDGINSVRQQIVSEICRETKSECPEAEMDLIFLVDGSSSIGKESFNTVKNWMITFVNQFEIGEYNSKIGVIQYSNEPRLEINLTRFLERRALTEAIKNMKYLTGEGHTGAALKYLGSHGFPMDSGARENVPKVVIVLTDGDSRDSVAMPAQLLRDQLVYIYAVGVGDTRQSELRSIASSDENVFHVRNYDAIPTIQSSLVRRVCQKVQIECRENATDIVLLIDGSNSVGYRDWDLVKGFLRNITERFHIGPEGVQVGVVQYSTYPKMEFAMKDNFDISALEKAIDSIDWMKGDTHTAQALRFVRQEALTSHAGSRGSNVSKILIVVTDGDAQDSDEVPKEAAAIHADGWRVFAIGVGQATIPELNVIASDPDQDHVFHADSYESTRKLKGRLVRMICTEYIIDREEVGTDEPEVVDDFDVLVDEHLTLELKEPKVVDIHRNNFSQIINLSDPNIILTDPGFDVDEKNGRRKSPPGAPDDLINDGHRTSSPNGPSDSINDGRRTSPPGAPDDLINDGRHISRPGAPGDLNKDGPSTSPPGAPGDSNNDDRRTPPPGAPDDLIEDGRRTSPPGAPDDLINDGRHTSPPDILQPRSPIPADYVDTSCPKVKRNNETWVKGFDILKELNVKTDPGALKPKRSALVNAFIGSPERFKSVKSKPGSMGSESSYRLTSRLGLSYTLNKGIAQALEDPVNFVATFRMQGSTSTMNWTFFNLTDENEQTVLSVSFSGQQQTMSLGFLTPKGTRYNEIDSPGVKSLFDRDFHKLEVQVKEPKILIKIDCVSLPKINIKFRQPRHVSTSLTGSLVMMSSHNDVSDQAIVDVQEIILKCDTSEVEQCCELPGKMCTLTLGTPYPTTPKALEKCICPPGPQGPPGLPGKTLRRGVRGKPGPRGHPGSSTCPPVTKANVRNIARKVANSIINEEFKKFYRVILKSVNDDGTLNASHIHSVLKKIESNAPVLKTDISSSRRVHHRKSRPGFRTPKLEDDCGDTPCDTIPADILDNL